MGLPSKSLNSITKSTKLGPKIVDCVFIGFINNSDACRFLVLKFDVSHINVNIIIESIDVDFFEGIFPYKCRSSSSKKRTHDEPSTSSVQEQNLEPE